MKKVIGKDQLHWDKTMDNFIEKKIKLEAIIFTDIFKIEGSIYIVPGERVSDFMTSANGSKFIPVTDARIFEIGSSSLLQKTEFLSLNKEKIVTLLPKSNLQKMDYQKAFYDQKNL